MTVFFEQPLWWLMGAALVPLAVHLVARTRPRERSFSSVSLLQELIRLQAHRTRPKDWLLLLLRTLACACIAAAFLLPYWGGGTEGEGGRALVMVLDNTASMGAADGQQVRMNQALEVAHASVKALGSGDRANLVTLAGYPQFLFDKPESAHPLLLRELARTQSEPASAAGVAEALENAARQINTLPKGMRGQVLVISDFQRQAMKAPLEGFLKNHPGLNIRCVSVAQAERLENTAVTRLSLVPAKPLPGQEVVATVQLRHWNGIREEQGVIPVSVMLSAGGLRLSQPCELPRGGETSVQFHLKAPEQGGSWELTARTEEDAFPGDNVRYLSVPVAERLDCLAISPDRDSLGFMLRALENMPFMQTLCLPGLTGNQADFVVWNAPTAADVPAIKECLESGATVLVAPDLQNDTACKPLLEGKEGSCTGEVRKDVGAWQLELPGEDESFSLFRPESLRKLCSEGIYARLGGSFGQNLPAGATVLLRYRDKVPALLRYPVGRGCLLVWNMPVLARDSRWGFSPLCLPVMAEVLLHARGGKDDAMEAVAGQDHLSFPLPAGVAPDRVKLFNQQGEEIPVAVSASSSGRLSVLRSESPAAPGIYRWQCGDEILGSAAVNFPLEESDLHSYVPEEGQEAEFLTAEEAVAHAGLAPRRALWPWLLAAALAFFAMELLLCRSARRKQPSETL